MKWRSSLLLIRMEWSIRLSDELNRKHMEWAILCVFGFSFWVDRTYVFPNWTYIEERKGKYPKDRTLGEGRHEMERKVGYKMRKRGENVQNAA